MGFFFRKFDGWWVEWLEINFGKTLNERELPLLTPKRETRVTNYPLQLTDCSRLTISFFFYDTSSKARSICLWSVLFGDFQRETQATHRATGRLMDVTRTRGFQTLWPQCVVVTTLLTLAYLWEYLMIHRYNNLLYSFMQERILCRLPWNFSEWIKIPIRVNAIYYKCLLRRHFSNSTSTSQLSI